MDKEHIEKHRAILLNILQNSINPRSELHEIFKKRIHTIMFNGMCHWLEHVSVLCKKEDFEEKYLEYYEKWLTEFIESCFVAGE